MSIILIINDKEEIILIPNESIRIRVIANSNNKKDIMIKENVKENLNIEIEKLLKDVKNINDARNILQENLNNIKVIVKRDLIRNNFYKEFKINYGNNYFPEKEYKGIKYNEGYYESLVVTIGEGKGNNYWCVLYPPLCLIDEHNKEKIEYRSYIKDILNKYL